MAEYRVKWQINLEADDPNDAARKALSIQRDPASIATVFDVYSPRSRKVATVDLGNVRSAPTKLYFGVSVDRGKVAQVKLFRTESDADEFVHSFESTYGIRTVRERKHQRDASDIYADCYEFTL
jgi:hypothetical protein